MNPRVVFLLLCLALGRSAGANEPILRFATTTTTENSGLIAVLIPAFERLTGLSVHVIATGSGRALKLLAKGDVDVSLTHARHLEQELVANGQALNHAPVMYNDFVLVGPDSDPARVREAPGILEGLSGVARSRALFLSRADQSGTHVRELALWIDAGVEPRGDWYRQTGQGMGKTLQMAGELNAYTLVDRGTWLAYRQRAPLALLYQGDVRLLNLYSVLSANPAMHDDVNAAGARALSEWLQSATAKRIIREFRIDGHQLFVPVL